MIRIKLNWEKNAAKLAARLCEKLVMREIIPVLNRSQIILDDSSSHNPLTPEEARQLTMSALSEARIKFRSISNSRNEIFVDDEKPEPDKELEARFFICPHCGFITPYEEEYWNHLKIHYVGF